MNEEVKLKQFIPAEREVVFSYFIRPELLERWCAPDGMSLKIPFFDARPGGEYRYEHTGKEGLYVCTGYVKEIHAGERLVQMDEVIKGPDGKTSMENLETIAEFTGKAGGTEITVTQKGFGDSKTKDICQEGWDQCLKKLSQIFKAESAQERRVS